MTTLRDKSGAVLEDQAVELAILTNGSGAASVASAPLTGQLYGVQFTDTNLDAGVDITISTARQGTILTLTDQAASTFVRPRAAIHDSAGAAISDVYDLIHLFDEVVTVAVASGGASHTGLITLLIKRGL